MSIPTRFSREWVGKNPKQWKELCKPPDECPVCLEPMVGKKRPLSPLLGDYPTACRHFCCRSCWLDIFVAGAPWKCPVCREDIADWLGHVFKATLRVERVDSKLTRHFIMRCIVLMDDGGVLDPETYHIGSALLQQLGDEDPEDAD